MTSLSEREAARRGQVALDAALVALGCLPLDENSDFQVADSAVGELLTLALEKQGVAPLRFVFGADLEVWVGPFSDVITVAVADMSAEQLRAQMMLVLRSSVDVHRARRSTQIMLSVQDEVPWLRLKVRAFGQSKPLEGKFDAYVGRADAG